MQLVVDLHIHSKYSRATSKEMDLESLYRWAKIKGINVLGTGDFTHPGWMAELREKLEPAEPGLFKLKKKLSEKQKKSLPESVRDELMRFILTVEISNIYSKGGKVRKMHNIVIVPSFEAASRLVAELSKIGNLRADGRPILGLDSKELLKMTLASDEESLLIPAHIWTPWFSLFGSKSGFDSLKEAFGELAGEIKAVETGLSSDPFMNWRWSELDGITLVSSSDAHSPRKLGREANVIESELSYKEIIGAIKTGDKRMKGTIEFFPQEGKYHFDGHRVCGVRMSPVESKKHNNLCPKCGKKLVLGVDHRVMDLADRTEDYRPKKHKQVEYIIPLAELIAEAKGVKSVRNKGVEEKYGEMIERLGDEFSILRKVKIARIASWFPQMAQVIEKMRKGLIVIEPGYDGVFGKIKILEDKKQMGLF